MGLKLYAHLHRKIAIRILYGQANKGNSSIGSLPLS
jgi:hypothetical protein